MYETNALRKGLRIEIDGHPYIVVSSQLVKPGKGQAFCRVKIKNLFSGNVIDRTYKSGEKIEKADVVDVTMQFLYIEGETYHFMDQKSYEQYELTKEQVGDAWKWLQEQTSVSIVMYKDAPISITLPNFAVLEITYCEPGIKGDTATGSTKPATLSTDAIIQVPLFVNQGDFLRIDTRTGEYVERVKV
ncbi:MAG: elongation factor P [bacterium]|jgi:elongation factor P